MHSLPQSHVQSEAFVARSLPLQQLHAQPPLHIHCLKNITRRQVRRVRLKAHRAARQRLPTPRLLRHACLRHAYLLRRTLP